MVSRVFLARHAQTQSGEEELVEGWSDGTLSLLGEKQAHALGRRLEPGGVDVIVSSDLLRCRQTVEHLGLQARVEFNRDLREANFGVWEGLPWSEVALSDYDAEPASRPPEGESLVDLDRRVVPAFRQLLQKPEETLLIVSHHNPIILMLGALTQTPIRSWRVFKQGNASLNELIFEEGHWRIAAVNDSCHLRGLKN